MKSFAIVLGICAYAVATPFYPSEAPRRGESNEYEQRTLSRLGYTNVPTYVGGIRPYAGGAPRIGTPGVVSVGTSPLASGSYYSPAAVSFPYASSSPISSIYGTSGSGIPVSYSGMSSPAIDIMYGTGSHGVISPAVSPISPVAGGVSSIVSSGGWSPGTGAISPGLYRSSLSSPILTGGISTYPSPIVYPSSIATSPGVPAALGSTYVPSSLDIRTAGLYPGSTASSPGGPVALGSTSMIPYSGTIGRSSLAHYSTPSSLGGSIAVGGYSPEASVYRNVESGTADWRIGSGVADWRLRGTALNTVGDSRFTAGSLNYNSAAINPIGTVSVNDGGRIGLTTRAGGIRVAGIDSMGALRLTNPGSIPLSAPGVPNTRVV